jgi:hypothetical protein
MVAQEVSKQVLTIVAEHFPLNGAGVITGISIRQRLGDIVQVDIFHCPQDHPDETSAADLCNLHVALTEALKPRRSSVRTFEQH